MFTYTPPSYQFKEGGKLPAFASPYPSPKERGCGRSCRIASDFVKMLYYMYPFATHNFLEKDMVRFLVYAKN